MRKLILCTLTVLFFTATSVLALEKGDEEALSNTLKLMNDPNAMSAYASGNGDASRALDQANQLTHGNKAQQAELMNLSSIIFADMVKQSNGDAVAIQSKLQQAMKDPNSFMKTLSPEAQSKLRQLAAEMDKQNSSGTLRSPASK
jgi:hypothetical protein